MTIGKKIGLGFAGPLVILLAIAALASWSTFQLVETAQSVTRTHQILADLEALLSVLKDAERGQRGYLFTGENEYLEPYNDAVASWEKLYNDLVDLTNSPDQKRRLADLKPLLVEKFKELKETITLRNADMQKGPEEALKVVRTGRGRQVMGQIQVIMKELKDAQNEILARRDAEVKTSGAITYWSIGLGALIAVVLVFLVGFFVLRSITHPVRSAINLLTTASAEILATTTLQAAGAREQATAVTETVATVDEVTQTSEQATLRAKGLGDAVQRTLQIGQAGRKAVDDSIAALAKVQEQVEATAENILALAEQAQAIGEITAAVADVAEQTNLLALNAAIEASRAGEHGKGFAVVASEVKALADQSKKATAQVRQILSEIQKGTNAAVLSTEDVTKGVGGASRVTDQAGQTIKALAETLAEAAQAAAQITASAGQQATGMGQIHQAMRSIDEAARQNLATLSQAEQAAQNLNTLGVQFTKLIGK